MPESHLPRRARDRAFVVRPLLESAFAALLLLATLLASPLVSAAPCPFPLPAVVVDSDADQGQDDGDPWP